MDASEAVKAANPMHAGHVQQVAGEPDARGAVPVNCSCGMQLVAFVKTEEGTSADTDMAVHVEAGATDTTEAPTPRHQRRARGED